MIRSKSQEETEKIAQKLAKQTTKGSIICLYGDLGSGKTAFSKAFIAAFGIKNFAVKSPTYTYIRSYHTKDHNIYHIDLYRLEEIDDLLLQEIEELMENKKNIIIIEWADKMKQKLPKKRIDIYFKYLDLNTREITINEQGGN